MKIDINKLREMPINELNEFYRGKIPHKVKDDDNFFKMLYMIYDKIGITPTTEQHNIILSACSGDAPILVDSCAGSGKTTLSQILILIYEFAFRVPAIRILNITYSSQASIDMKARHALFCSKFGIESKIDMRTMHSFYSAFIKEYSTKLGMVSYSPSENLLQDNEVYEMLRPIYLNALSTKVVANDTLKEIYSVMCYIKDSLIEEYEIPSLKKFKDLDMKIDDFLKIVKGYEAQKRFSSPRRIDYNDMQTLFLQLITENPDILDRIKRSYERIIVDEFQDSSVIQLKILSLIAGNPNNILAIGDLDQQIYSWRGANTLAYNSFKSTFKGTELHTMGFNLRCPDTIIQKASALVKFNPNRNEKHMKGLAKEGNISVIPCKSTIAAINTTADLIEKDYREYGIRKLKNQVVLYRTHIQPMFLIDRLLKNDVPVNAVGTKLPYDDKITKDFINIYYMLENPRDGLLASQNLFKICKSLNKRQMSLVQKNLNGYNKITDLRTIANPQYWNKDLIMLNKAIELVENDATVAELANVVLPAYLDGYYNYVSEKTGVLKDHINAVVGYLRYQNVPFNAFMTDILKIQKKLRENNDLKLGITLGTVHSAKGLEWEKVYVLDPNQKVSPNEFTVEELAKINPKEALEYLIEELNLFYVAITRASSNLIIPYNEQIPSRFLYYANLLPKEQIGVFEQKFPQLTKTLDDLSRLLDKLDYINQDSDINKNLDLSDKVSSSIYPLATENEKAHAAYFNSCSIEVVTDKIADNIALDSTNINYSSCNTDKIDEKTSNSNLLDLDWDLDIAETSKPDIF